MYLFASIQEGYKKVYDRLESYGAALYVNRKSSNINCINDILIHFKHAVWIYSLLTRDKEQVAAGRDLPPL